MTLDDFETELAARRAAVARMAQVCPICGRSLAGHGGTYARGDTPEVWGPLPPFDGTQERVAEPTAGAGGFSGADNDN